MAQLSSAERAALPDRAFAYIDARGRRRLPIFDASHVRNALSRFDQVEFESDQERERSRRRLLAAAKRFRIVPIGFIDAEFRRERRSGLGSTESPPLPTGFVTMLMADIEGSTGLLAALGDDYGAVLDSVRVIQDRAVDGCGGHIVEARADDMFAAFASPRGAIEAATTIHHELGAREWPGGHHVRVRIGLHAGYPTTRDRNYIGMAVHTAARVSDAAHGGQTLVSGDTKAALSGMTPEGTTFRGRGTHRLRGIPGEVSLHQVVAVGLPTSFPRPRC